MSRPVPTVQQLAEMDREYAFAITWRKGDRKNDPPVPTAWHITAKGHALLGEIMRANALEAVARGEGEWVRPPDSGRRRDE